MKNLGYTLGFIFVLFAARLSAGEGMWLPFLLSQLNEAEMQSLGMKMTAEDIYSVNKGSLKDAIVHFGGFCSSTVISPDGLILTNHHCGYGQIQSHSTMTNNYIDDGFWAMNRSEELANPGLTATFIVKMVDVTADALQGVSKYNTEAERQSIIDKNLGILVDTLSRESYEDAYVKPFFEGNQYIAFVTITYKDIRLVGAPPSSIGKFGADTDNWVWPRHTGDFSLFRIYAGADNMPAEYSESNVPLKPKHFLPISLDGAAPGDFTLVFGFPGRTQSYLPSEAIRQVQDVIDPARIEIRDHALKIVDKHMRADDEVRIKYASKFARIANYWKKWIGEKDGLIAKDAVAKRQAQEAEFAARVSKNSTFNGEYANILYELTTTYVARESYELALNYYGEVFNRNIEVFQPIRYAQRFVKIYENNGLTGLTADLDRFSGRLQDFYKNYDSDIDKEVFADLLQLYMSNTSSDIQPDALREMLFRNGNQYDRLTSEFFANTNFDDASWLKRLQEAPATTIASLKADPGYKLYVALSEAIQTHVTKPKQQLDNRIDSLDRIYMRALIEVFPERKFYPNANSTMRVTYGQVQGYTPRDAVEYQPISYIEGVIEKYTPGDYEFDLPQRFLDLYEARDFGDYADETGSLPICFIGTNHTTGGNSGSCAIDAYGNIIGLNFDRVWEGTMSDINYDPDICRNIMVDMRYIMWIVDKYAGAGHLIEEMKLVRPKG